MILSRYSWSIEYFMGTKYSYYAKLKKAATHNMTEEGRHRFMPSVFHFWLEHINGSSTSPMPFDKLCIELGLIDAPPKPSKASSKQQAEKAIKRANEIIELDKKRQKRP